MTSLIDFFLVSILMLPLLLMIALPFVLATALLAAAVRLCGLGAATPRARIVLVGTVMPLLLLAVGLWLLWPWLGHPPAVRRDGFPPEPLPAMAALPTWLCCLLVSRRMLRRAR